MSAEATTHAGHASSLPISHEKVGMISFLVTEAAFFTTLIMSYLYYIGKSKTGPQPADVFEDISVTIISTVLLLSSSITVHLADGAFKKGKHSVFVRFWFLTIALGVAFLVGTAIEWHGLIFEHDLTIATNFFRHDLFHSGRFSRFPRDARRADDEYSLLSGPVATRPARQDGKCGVGFVVLAFC
ncbi:MAG: hypothetical protein KatS3mg105_4160 [Gemmatales bacterium]|nr:MAG: hypothetical protein KatS3mg105_4160 [Gemmatales bacterium]